ncbi:MAG: phosphonate metabolism protein/1,5-bisphosphokinase (PRPP-forming) PhnN [Burkholderiales bacterium]|nr:phosphonate metabolism protein/1,5-bisphosphokinase (PRPP-forming) PhnN [Burkholderiales bacterium]
MRDAFLNGAADRGRLVYLVGPSGAGKDSLLAWVRAQRPARVRVAPRAVTRATGGGTDFAVSEARFAALLARGAFALYWRANGLAYGVPRAIERWLAAGLTVVVNGSRAHLAEARLRFPALEAVHVTAPKLLLARRLAQRAREPEAEIVRRLARNDDAFAAVPEAALTIVNDGPLAHAGRQLLEFVEPRPVPAHERPVPSRNL